MEIYLNGIITTHQLVKEFLSKPDDFLTVTVGDREYSIRAIKKVRTHANVDDGVTHTTLICNELGGNIIR